MTPPPVGGSRNVVSGRGGGLYVLLGGGMFPRISFPEHIEPCRQSARRRKRTPCAWMASGCGVVELPTE